MKVISGILKGRTIKGYDINGTRPTMDRVKESLFATIQNYINESVVLDLFSGSGNLGIESISNGSKLCYFNDNSKDAIKIIKENIDNLNIKDKCIVINKDYNSCIEYLKNENVKLDIVFLDPPYKDLILNEIIEKLIEYNLLNSNALVVCEVSKNYLKEFKYLEKIKEKKYGDKYAIIFRRND